MRGRILRKRFKISDVIQKKTINNKFGNSTFAAVGYSGTILTSSDNGTTWASRSSGTSKYLRRVTYGNSSFVTVGNGGTILTSSDGTSWTSRSSGTSNNLNGITYGNSTFVATFDSSSTNPNRVTTSSDGKTWTQWDTPLIAEYLLWYIYRIM